MSTNPVRIEHMTIVDVEPQEVVVDTVEALMLSRDPRKAETGIALAAELGARAIVAINIATVDDAAAAGQLAELCALANGYGLLVCLEPISIGATRTPADGLRILRQSGATNARLAIDLLHVVRTGTSLADVAVIEPGLFGSAQLCDGPMQIAQPELIEDASASRMEPGRGGFPVREFLRLIPAWVPVRLDVPQRALRDLRAPHIEKPPYPRNANVTRTA